MEISGTQLAITADDGPSDYASSFQGTMEPSSEKTTEDQSEPKSKIDLTNLASGF